MSATLLYDAVLPAFRALEGRLVRKERLVEDISTGIDALDDALDGLRPGDVVLLSGDRLADARWLARFIAIEVPRRSASPVGVLYVTSRDTAEQVALRLIALESGVPLRRLRGPELNEFEVGAVTEAANGLSQLPVWIVEVEVT